MSAKINVNGAILDPAQATVPAMDHGFLFGDSVYETFRTYGGRFFRLGDHVLRLGASAEALELRLPIDAADFERRTLETMAAAGESNAAIRIVVTRGVGPMDLDPTRCDAPNVLVYVRPRPRHPEETYREGITLRVVARARNPRRALDPNVKSGNYLNNMLALVEARKAGAFESVMLNAEGFVTEGSTSNVFFVKDGAVRTPALGSGLLAGITRKTVLDLAASLGFPVEEREVRPEDLRGADEVFITSTLKQVMPVARVDDLNVGSGLPGPVTLRLLDAYRAAVRAETGVTNTEE